MQHPWKTFLVQYRNPLDGRWYGTTITARHWEEAETICAEHGLTLDGIYEFTLPGWLPRWIVRLILWNRNRHSA